MEAKIQEILNDIFELEPSMIGNKDNIEEIVKKMLEIKPDTNFDKNFEIRLKNQLLQEIGSKKVKKQNTNYLWNSIIVAIGTITLAGASGILITTNIFKPEEKIKPEISYVNEGARSINDNIQKKNIQIEESSKIIAPNENNEVSGNNETKINSKKVNGTNNNKNIQRETKKSDEKIESKENNSENSNIGNNRESDNEESTALMSFSSLMKGVQSSGTTNDDSANSKIASDTYVSYNYIYKGEKLKVDQNIINSYSGSKIFSDFDEIIKIAENGGNYKNPGLPQEEIELGTPKIENIIIGEQTIPTYVFPVLNKKEGNDIPDKIYVNLIIN